MTNKTVSDIYGMAQDLLKIDGSTIGIPGMEEARTINWIDDLHQQFFQEFENRGVSGPDYMAKQTGFNAASETALTVLASASATTLTISSSSALPTSGAGYIYTSYQYDIFEFTGNASGSVTGVSGVDFDHAIGESVARLYALPTDFQRPRKGIEHEGVRVSGVGYERAAEPGPRLFSLYQSSLNAWHLWLPKQTTGSIFVTYDKKPTSLTATTSTLDVTQPDHMYLVWGLLGIFKQIQDDDYIPNKEEAQKQKIITDAINRRSVGKRLNIGNAHFNRAGMTRQLFNPNAR